MKRESIGGESAKAAIINVFLIDEEYLVCDKAACAFGIIGKEKSVMDLRQAMLKQGRWL